MLQNHAARVITGARYEIRLNDPLESLQWDSLHVRHVKLKSVLLYKVLKENLVPCLRESFVRLRDLNRGYDLHNLETDLALPKLKTNFLK